MNGWLIRIRRHDRPWGELSLDVAETELAMVLARFPASDGFRCFVFRRNESRRFLESTPAGLRVIAVEHREEPWAASNPSETSLPREAVEA